MEREEIVAALLKAAGGQLVGRVRLQKTVYLLDQLGLESGFDYDYHHYGPFSRDIDNAVADAEAFELVEEKFGRRQVDGARYSIFKLTDEGYELPAMIGRLDGVELQRLLQEFQEANVTVLELAATANWLVKEEGQDDWQESLRRRKGRKVNGGRLDRALALLRDIGLPPGTVEASA
ncbi:MAG: hypothetical protein OXC01_12650 [Immundisolibacterales bacterium]|nr:hypothetical protein [Immundisolibacterales bacterium]